MDSETSSCAGFLPSSKAHSVCSKCSRVKAEHNAVFISPMVMGKPPNAKRNARKPPPRPKTSPNFQHATEQGKLKQQPKEEKVKTEEKAAAGLKTAGDSVSRRRAISPAPEVPERSSRHKARKLQQKLIRDTNSVVSSDIQATAVDKLRNISNEHETTESKGRASRSVKRNKLKRRAPTPVRKISDGTEAKHIDKSTEASKVSPETGELEKMLKRKLATINAQLSYIDQKVNKAVKPAAEAISTTDAKSTAQIEEDSIKADSTSSLCSDDNTPTNISTHRVTFSTEECVIINDIIGDLWYDVENVTSEESCDENSDDNSQHTELEDIASDIFEETTGDNYFTSADELAKDRDSDYFDKTASPDGLGEIDDLTRDSMKESVEECHTCLSHSTDLECSEETTPAVHIAGPKEDTTHRRQERRNSAEGARDLEPDRSRASRSKERRRKEPAPTPPSVKAPSLSNMALRMDSKQYYYNKSKGYPNMEGGGLVAQSEPPKRVSRSRSVDRPVEKPQKKMPPAKSFFKTLLRKGKSKQDVLATEFEVASPTHTEPELDHSAEEEEEIEIEGKLPKEFLDTWVSSTTHQLMDEMDMALKGVWPYDKKEDTSSYRRKSSSSEGLMESINDTQTTLKKKSKHQVPSSNWSDRGGVDPAASNFILKEKTKKESTGSSNGSLRNMHSQFKSPQPSLQSQTLQRPGRRSPAPSKERRSSRELAVTELDGSLPKTKFREQFLQKLQREGQLNNSVGRESRPVSQGDVIAAGGTLMKKKNKSSEMLSTASYSGSNHTWDNKHQVSSILKNGSNSSTPNGTISKSKKTAPVASHGRQSSVPSSTYSGSSSGQSGEFRSKEELPEGKISPSNSNPHDSGYESGTMRSRMEMSPSHHHQDAFESGTMRSRKDVLSMPLQPRDSGYESGTMRSRRDGGFSNSDLSTLKRVKRSPTLSLTSRSTPRGPSTAIDSIPLCFDQLTAMNVSTLQQLCANYIQNQRQEVTSTPEETTPRWHDIGLIDELTPVFSSTKLVLYKGYWRTNPQEIFTVMLSLREPVKFQAYKPNLLRTSVTFEANVPPHLIPSSLYTGKKLMKNHTSASQVDATPKTPSVQAPETKSRTFSTPALMSHASVDESLMNGRGGYRSVTSVDSRVPSVPTPTVNRDSVFTNQSSRDSVESIECIQEQAAIDSILLAVAGEEEPELQEISEKQSQRALPTKGSAANTSTEPEKTAPEPKPINLTSEPAKVLPAPVKLTAEPVKLSTRMEAFTSAVKKPAAERFTSTKTLELYNSPSNSRKNNNVDKILPTLKGAGLVRNRIANLNSSNNNNNTDDEEDDEFDLQALNSNNNNNLDDIMPSASGGEFVFASHLLEMAGGEMHQPQAEELDTTDSSPTPVPRGAAGLMRCEDKVSSAQNVTCYVTILPSLPKVESIKSYIERLKSEDRDKEELQMDIIFVLLQILNIVFNLHESQLRLDSISTSDFLVVTDSDNVSTIHCHMINVTQAPNQKIGLTCEKLRMFLMQVSHSVESLQKSVIFTTVDDLIQNAEDLGDLRTISAILQYLLWGPKEEEVKVITLAEHRRQAFELWLQLARGKLLSSLAIKPIDNLKANMVTNFLANTNGSELFKITKLLNTY